MAMKQVNPPVLSTNSMLDVLNSDQVMKNYYQWLVNFSTMV